MAENPSYRYKKLGHPLFSSPRFRARLPLRGSYAIWATRLLMPALVLPSFLFPAAARADTPVDALRPAIERGLRRIEKGAANYTVHRQCFSCHHQAMPILSMTSAKRHGFTIRPEKARQQIDFTLDYFRPKKREIAKGQWMPGGNTMAAYALMAFEAADHPPDEITSALVQYLVAHQRPDGSWPALTSRPPTEGSTFANNALAIRALRTYGLAKKAVGSEDLRTGIQTALRKGESWLRQQEPVTMEDKVYRLRGLIHVGADKKEIQSLLDRLLKEQQADGSWAQLPDLAGDAYATGNVLMALRAAGLDSAHPAYQKGIRFLLASQRPDGAWIVQTRSRPVQTFFDNEDPGDKSQFISFVATNWGVLALLDAYGRP
jgi:N-acyl-D-amino-acid deacylase